ncbi:MAG: hypothetical protein IT377_03050 [Polyangiaceae bacterium]|nr:hypothetical protein [Myxococcales bacterium]MCC6897923.1 hypothetical protein [Polyangiaceae bacterium]
MAVLLVSIELALGILVPWWIVRRDLKKLDGARLARAWNDASFWSAIVLFGPLSLPFHFTKTRRSLLGFVLGLAWMVAAFLTIGLLGSGLSLLFGVE